MPAERRMYLTEAAVPDEALKLIRESLDPRYLGLEVTVDVAYYLSDAEARDLGLVSEDRVQGPRVRAIDLTR